MLWFSCASRTCYASIWWNSDVCFLFILCKCLQMANILIVSISMGLTFPGVEHLQDKITTKAFQSQSISLDVSYENHLNECYWHVLSIVFTFSHFNLVCFMILMYVCIYPFVLPPWRNKRWWFDVTETTVDIGNNFRHNFNLNLFWEQKLTPYRYSSCCFFWLFLFGRHSSKKPKAPSVQIRSLSKLAVMGIS